jgi:NADH-quinone oxidoreductase subunit L
VLGAAEVHHDSVGSELIVTLVTLAVVVVGFLLAYSKYGKASAQTEPQTGGGVFYQISLNKFYVDQGYDFLFVRPFTALASICARFIDPWVIDGTVNGVAATARGLSNVWRYLQTGNVQHYAAMFLTGALALLAYFLGQL